MIAIVTGSSGFIGGHLVRHLMGKGYFVIGADLVEPLYEKPSIFFQSDLRDFAQCEKLFKLLPVAEVYNLACLMGGMGYIGNAKHHYDIMIGSSQIVANVIECSVRHGVKRHFYSSSACVYNMDLQSGTVCSLKERDAYPALPDLMYGWQKLFSEKMYEAAASKGLDVRIGRFHNIFGPEGTYDGGKEKAPAALCRKVARADREIEVWGDGEQTRSFLYIDECIEGIMRLMKSAHTKPLNIGSDELISINDLARMVIAISGKDISIKNVPGQVGVRGRNSDNTLIKEVLGWSPSQPLRNGMEKTYKWIESVCREN